MLKSISTNNIKGRSAEIKLSALTLITGANMSGKSTILTALRLAVLGYLPELGKRPSDTAAIAGDQSRPFSVQVTFDSGSLLFKGTPKPKGGYTIGSDSHGNIDPQIAAIISTINWHGFLEAKPSERLNVLAGLTDAELTELVELFPAQANSSAAELLAYSKEKLEGYKEAMKEQNAIKKRAEQSNRQIMATADMPRRPTLDLQALHSKAGELREAIRQLKMIAEQTVPAERLDVSTCASAYTAALTETQRIGKEQNELRKVPKAQSLEYVRGELEKLKQAQPAAKPYPDADSKHSEALGAFKPIQARAREIAAEVSRLQSVPTSKGDEAVILCPCCKQPWDRESALKDAQDKQKLIDSELALANKTILALQSEQNANSMWTARATKIEDLERALPLAEAWHAAQQKLEQLAGEMSNANQELDECKTQLELAKQQENIPSAAHISGAKLELADKEQELEKVLADIQKTTNESKAWEEHESRERILKNAEETAEKATEEALRLKGLIEAVTAATQSAVQRICKPLIDAAAAITEPVCGKGLRMEGDEIGLYSYDVDRIIPFDLLSGTEQKLVSAALQMVLGSGGIICLDEMSDLDREHRPRLVNELESAVLSGRLQQVIVIDHETSAYSTQWTCNTVR